jgi:probable HAF family extracellular repeat protein
MIPIRRLNVMVAATAVALATAVSPATAATPPVAAERPDVVTGRLITLGTLGGGQSWGEQMNARGDIIGGSLDAANNYQPALWWHGRSTPTLLRVGPAGLGAISDNGHIVGQVFRTGRQFVWRNGVVTYLRPPAGAHLEVTGVNNDDQVVGTAYYRNGTTRAVLWQAGHYTVLPVPKGTDSTAAGINNLGQSIGTVIRRGATDGQAVLWQHGRMIKLGSLGGAASSPVSINDRGQVIGNSAVRASSAEHPFLWQRGRMTDLLRRTTATGGRAYALSDTGLVSGTAIGRNGTSRPVLWRSGRMIDVGLPGHTAIASVVNDRGDVAGLTWARPDAMGMPFRWQRGEVTLFPKPFADIAVRVLGIDPHGTIGVAQETTYPGFVVLRSA